MDVLQLCSQYMAHLEKAPLRVDLSPPTDDCIDVDGYGGPGTTESVETNTNIML